jgi:tRNA(fMet)-specific endonuclease VapC
VTTYLLDTTVLVAHLRGESDVTDHLLELVRDGHVLSTSAVNVAEIHRGALPSERRATTALLDRLAYLTTTIEAARRAGVYQRDLAAKGVTIHTPDALIAGTARAHGAVVMTDNRKDFPMRDVRVEIQPRAASFERLTEA